LVLALGALVVAAVLEDGAGVEVRRRRQVAVTDAREVRRQRAAVGAVGVGLLGGFPLLDRGVELGLAAGRDLGLLGLLGRRLLLLLLLLLGLLDLRRRGWLGRGLVLGLRRRRRRRLVLVALRHGSPGVRATDHRGREPRRD